jgi:hypothetical protein
MEKQTDLHNVIRILTLINVPPNLKDRTTAKDIVGDFDYRFDGGTVRLKMGYTEYLFDNGDRATIHVLPYLAIDIHLANHKEISIREEQEK